MIAIKIFEHDPTGYLVLEKSGETIGCFDKRYIEILSQALGKGVNIKTNHEAS